MKRDVTIKTDFSGMEKVRTKMEDMHTDMWMLLEKEKRYIVGD